MTAERWKRISEIYDSVADAAPFIRSLKLEEACGPDENLRQEIASLLNARDEAGDFLSPSDLCQHIRQLSFGEADSLPGATVGRYAISAVIGSGGMGNVYLATDVELNRPVALKLLPIRFAGDPDKVARFRREARAASALNHPNIVTVYDVGQADDTFFIATEFIEGITLRARLEAGAMQIEEAIDVALQCSLALEAAHASSILHRDIKPENILIRPDGRVKIVDFGLARSMKDRLEVLDGATQTGAVIGTPRYMSPEQARAQHLDARTDVFSLGAVTYEMVSGRPAFRGTTTAEIFAALLDAEPEPLSPAALDAIIRKALTKDPAARYQTIRDFAADLRQFREMPASLDARAQQGPRRAVSRRAILTGAASAAVTIFGARELHRRWSKDTVRDGAATSATPLTSFAGLKDFGSFAPDEERIAFSWNGGEGGSGGRQERNIYIKKLKSDEPVRLTYAQQDDRHPAWSPDGKSIAFCRLTDNRTPYMRFGLWTIPAAGGAERWIGEGGEGVSWSPDGRSLAIAGLPPESGGIYRFWPETGKRVRLTQSNASLDQLPVFSPDGKWIVFTRSLGPRSRELFIVGARGGREKQITFDNQPTFGAAWTADSRDIVFSSNRGGGGESLWRVSLGDRVPRRLAGALGGAFFPAISKTGDQLIFTESFEDTNIYASEGLGFNGRSAPRPFGIPKSFISSSRRDDSPDISPDGSRVAFVSRRTGNEEIWVSDGDGSHARQLTFFRGPATGTPRWSPDGRRLAFDSIVAGNPDLYLISADGGSPRRISTGSYASYMPSWSADGKTIYFKSDRSHSDQIWSIPAEGGDATQVTQKGGVEALASPDGQMLYYTQREWGALWQIAVGGGTEQPVPELQRYDQIFRSWGVAQQGIYFMSREPSRRQTVRFFSFDTRQVSSLLTLEAEPIWNYPNVALSLNGQKLLTVRLEQEVNDLMVIENFH